MNACQQCFRTIATRARRENINLNVLDLTQLVMKSLTQE